MTEMNATILKEFELFSLGGEGIGGWLNEGTDQEVFDRLAKIDEKPLSRSQLNQLLVFGHEATVSDGFFQYYWLTDPRNQKHPYLVEKLPGFEETFFNLSETINSLAHLKWGLYRLYTDALLYFGNVRTAYRKLRGLTQSELETFFKRETFETDDISERGPSLELQKIPIDDRHLISEMAANSFGELETPGDMKQILLQRLQDYIDNGGGPITVRDLIKELIKAEKYAPRQTELNLSCNEIMDETVTSQSDLENKIDKIAERYFAARKKALKNTRYFLSMVSELDVYVATSMRTREDFRHMAKFCSTVFEDNSLKNLRLRYFDPTVSAAANPVDKGLIECLMVNCAKALVYYGGEKDSYGKDAEAAMALSLGKPVIFYCDPKIADKADFFRKVHPLTRLIDFKTGVAVGAIVTEHEDYVAKLLQRIFENKMEYVLEKETTGSNKEPGPLRLKEVLTGSVVRVQTGNRMLAETFWNHYHRS